MTHSQQAVITGASRGLGRALAAGLARAGYDIIIDARDGDALADARNAIEEQAPGAAITAVAGDITDPAHRAELARAAANITLLVNNAGTLGAAPLPALANVLAAEETAIRVWWADPGDLRTDMHQLAFPGEDISDRPLPEEIVPAFLRLITERLPSGRYRAAHLLPAAR